MKLYSGNLSDMRGKGKPRATLTSFYSGQGYKEQFRLYLFHERELDMRWWIANEARSAELTITISYPTSASEIIV